MSFQVRIDDKHAATIDAAVNDPRTPFTSRAHVINYILENSVPLSRLKMLFRG